MSEEKLKKTGTDMKAKVMSEIRKKKIGITSHSRIVAEKLGMEGIIAADILTGAFIISIVFYIFKKTKVLKFLSLGVPGLKVILLTIPYGYIAVLAGAVLLAFYLISKLDLCYETKCSHNFIIFTLFGSIFIIGMIFIAAGVHEYFESLTKNKMPKERSIIGKIDQVDEGGVTLEEEDGQMVKVKFGKNIKLDNNFEGIRGKYLRAVGERDSKNVHYFRAESVLCCDED
jgi:hypothetical protein